ncbi:MAG: glycosyltransferase [Lachnospiraceae bacterium]|nr:glycosyltransferase [Lachnospiraceae bacterium]
MLNSLDQTTVPYALFLINDCSTDEKITSYLEAYSKEHKNTTVLQNPEQLGYIKSVNQVLRVATHHVVLLNTDVILPKGWLERLLLPILSDSTVASATPFTNSGTICSFPIQFQNNDLFAGLSVAEIDDNFRKISPRYPAVPTGVGFCLALNHKAITDIGVYDDVNYLIAYGEENDWCQRAIQAGYKNVIVDNLFVYHKHNSSYNRADSSWFRNHNEDMLRQKHPMYNFAIETYMNNNPNIPFINLLTMLCSCNDKRSSTYLVFCHILGGDADSFITNRIENDLSNGSSYLLISFREHSYYLQYCYQHFSFGFPLQSLATLEDFCKNIHISEILINELVTYPNLYETLDVILRIKQNTSSKLTFYLHDFFAICPNITLFIDNHYCGLPDIDTCDNCPLSKFSRSHLYGLSIYEWRSHWNNFLSSCDNIIAFSKDSINLLKSTYDNLGEIQLSPHQVNYVTQVKKRKKAKDDPLIIGILGILPDYKGFSIVQDLLSIIAQKHLNIKVVQIGSSDLSADPAYFFQHGTYNQNEISHLTEHYGIDIFFLPFLCHETFSYTTEEAIKTGLPVAVFDIGAPPERVREYEHGLIIPEMNANCALDSIITYMNKESV